MNGLATSSLVETIKKFQEGNQLTADGQVGPATYAVLCSDLEDGASDALPLKLYSRGLRVRQFQYALRICCINPKGTDGIFGAGMQSAVNRYKTSKGLTADGMVDVTTWEKMREDIRPLQTALANRGYEVGQVDGIATEEVYNAVLQFQKDHNLTADGMIGSATKNLLLGGTSGTGTVSSTLKLGSNGSLTRYLQRLLNELGYQTPIDGIFSQETKNAAIAFQKANGLDADGIVGGGTWTKLFEEYQINPSGNDVEKLIAVAEHELAWGFAEDNANNITPYGQWYGMNGSAWCAMFVSYCAYQAGLLDALIPKYAWCPSGMSWYKKKNRYHKRQSEYVPKKGDIIFFYNFSALRVSHTGIVVDGDEDTVVTIEGNTASDKVERRTYSRTNVAIDGYGENFGTPIAETKVPTQEEIESAALDMLREFCENCSIPLPSVNLQLNQEYETMLSPNEKVVVEVCADTTLFDQSEQNPVSVVIDVKEGKVSGEASIEDKLGIALDGMKFDAKNVKMVFDTFTSINATIGDGRIVCEAGFTEDEEGEWAYLSIAAKSPALEIDPETEISLKYTYYIRKGSDDSKIVEKVLAFWEENKKTVASGIIILVVAFLAASNLIAGITAGLEALLLKGPSIFG